MTYSQIVAKIDAAIADGADKPLTLSRDGKTITYRGLAELLSARRHYAALAAAQAREGSLGITRIRGTSPR